ncbi:helix-turn-helix domain-containing protein [Lentzea sp. BCCO 10_0798]|uniref:Helix-turn-helix domain-containing protein n=1 Tax=Lentzea kristufekii TaxID=3095430 RepID=A0ABU4TK26_9PSEU|nr:helix-turn-helix domain-containing protein [Lentzea sp. BCCO 10_0798]MDX8048626.1 helix-turn-helix domain-containing protein [Lentzea sp. BCCO 10_0798]
MAEQSDVFGVELRRLRTAAGLSLAALAQQVHYSKGYLGKIETGFKQPGVDLARRCDAVLGAGGRLAALVDQPAPASPLAAVAADGDGDGEVWVMSMAPDGSSWMVPMPRRDAIATGAASLLGLTLGTPRAASASAAHDGTLAAFRSLFTEVRKLGQTTSPSVVLPMVTVHTHTLRGMANGAPAPVREQLLGLAARYSEYAGWMAQEAGDDRAAMWWTRNAVEMGAAAGDTEMATYSLIRQALITLYRDDAAGTVDLAQQAQAAPGTSPRVQGLAALREAQGHALACDYDNCRRALDRAAALLARADTADGMVMGSASVSGADLISLVEAWCLHDLGQSREAADVFDRQLSLVPDSAHRTHARFGARRALAYASAGDIDHASALTAKVLDAADLVDSATVRQDLKQLARLLGRERKQASVSEVYPRLNAALRSQLH